jgi:hypothetical protein
MRCSVAGSSIDHLRCSNHIVPMARDGSIVMARDGSIVMARDGSIVMARDGSIVDLLIGFAVVYQIDGREG